MKCNKTQSKWCTNKQGASKIIDTFETYHPATAPASPYPATAPASRQRRPTQPPRRRRPILPSRQHRLTLPPPQRCSTTLFLAGESRRRFLLLQWFRYFCVKVSSKNLAGVFLHDAMIEYFCCYFWSIFLHH
jgi:hypothetical protein